MKEQIREKIKKYQMQIKAVSVIVIGILLGAVVFFWGPLGEDDTIKIVYVPKVRDETDFWVQLVSGAESAAKEYQVDLEVLAPETEKDVEQQKRCIQQAIDMKPDVIVISPSLYTGMTELVEGATEEGIPLVLIDSELDKNIETSYISTDNVEAGIKTGQKVLEYVQEDTKIAIMSQAKGTSTAMQREEGVRKGLGDEEERIDMVLYCDSDNQIACDLTKELLTEQPDIDCIVGLNLCATMGVAKAVKELELGGKVHVIGLDSDKEGIEYMEMGIIDALVVQKPFYMGYFGIKTAVQIARGEKVEPEIYLDTEVITLDNIYSPENEKIVFPF